MAEIQSYGYLFLAFSGLIFFLLLVRIGIPCQGGKHAIDALIAGVWVVAVLFAVGMVRPYG